MLSDAFSARLGTVAEFTGIIERLSEAEVGGMTFDVQGYALFELARNGPGQGGIVEVGSFMGRSTCWLALGSRAACREKVLAVDHFTGSPEHQKGGTHEDKTIVEQGTTLPDFQRNIAAMGVTDYVDYFVGTSEEAVKNWEGPVRLLFIDGDHSFEAAKLDFDSWTPFVPPGGIVTMHDVGIFEGVTRFYNECVAPDETWVPLLNIKSLVIVEKRTDSD